MHIHLVGVAGTGMGCLAGLLVQQGHRVTGSDVAFHPPIGPELQAWGVECMLGFTPENLAQQPDLVVVGNVCRADNLEVRAAFERNLDITHIAGALSRFVLPGSIPLVVAGTHGKTTTSSLAAWLLQHGGSQPGFFIGGIPGNFGRGFRPPRTRGPFVMEGDEYDTAFFEKTAKFLHYQAEHAIVTSVEHDHIDIYPDEQSYFDAFIRFISELPESGVLVANANDAQVTRLVSEYARCRVEWTRVLESPAPVFDALWTARDVVQEGDAQSFELTRGGSSVGRFTLPLSGAHNLANALAALVACHRCFGVDLERMREGLPLFLGSKRRQELLAEVQGVRVYDDFAHHPTAVRQTLAGLKARHPQGRLFSVFEPRSATACRKLHQTRYAAAFEAADEVLIAPVGRPELAVQERLDTAQLEHDLCARGTIARAFSDGATTPSQPQPRVDALESIISHLSVRARPGDTIALLSNGAFGGIHAKLIRELASRNDSFEKEAEL